MSQEKDNRKYLSFFVPKMPCKKYAIMWRKPRQGKNKQNLFSLEFAPPPLLCLLSNADSCFFINCFGILVALKKYTRSLYRREHMEQVGCNSWEGGSMCITHCAFQRATWNSFWFCGWVQNWLQSAPRSEVSSTVYSTEGK